MSLLISQSREPGSCGRAGYALLWFAWERHRRPRLVSGWFTVRLARWFGFTSRDTRRLRRRLGHAATEQRTPISKLPDIALKTNPPRPRRQRTGPPSKGGFPDWRRTELQALSSGRRHFQTLKDHDHADIVQVFRSLAPGSPRIEIKTNA
jgi:hypothetical protein